MRSFLFCLVFMLMGSNTLFPNPVQNLPLYDRDGNRYLFWEILESSSTKGTVLNFTSVHCVPCKKEVPELLKLQETYKSKGMDLILVFLGDKDEEVVSKIQELAIPKSTRVFQDPLSISMRRLDFRSVPMTYIVDSSKNLVHTEVGFVEAKFQSMKSIVHKKLQ